MKTWGLLILVGAVVAFGIPLVRLATPGGARDPDSLGEALLMGLLAAVGTAVAVVLRAKMRSRASGTGSDQRGERGSRAEE
jgi:hypothetical protein